MSLYLHPPTPCSAPTYPFEDPAFHPTPFTTPSRLFRPTTYPPTFSSSFVVLRSRIRLSPDESSKFSAPRNFIVALSARALYKPFDYNRNFDGDKGESVSQFAKILLTCNVHSWNPSWTCRNSCNKGLEFHTAIPLITERWISSTNCISIALFPSFSLLLSFLSYFLFFSFFFSLSLSPNKIPQI